MAICYVLLFGDPRLREPASEVWDFDSPAVQKIMQNLSDTLVELKMRHGRGGGLAAPQIGDPVRIIHLNARDRAFFMFNPKIVNKGDEQFDVWDFCFSAKAAFVAKVSRYCSISVEYYDERGQHTVERFDDDWSELIQHEVDHLNGILFVDRVSHPQSIKMIEHL